MNGVAHSAQVISKSGMGLCLHESETEESALSALRGSCWRKCGGQLFSGTIAKSKRFRWGRVYSTAKTKSKVRSPMSQVYLKYPSWHQTFSSLRKAITPRKVDVGRWTLDRGLSFSWSVPPHALALFRLKFPGCSRLPDRRRDARSKLPRPTASRPASWK